MIPLALGLVGSVASGLLNKQKAAPTATFKPVNVAEEQKNAISGNLSNFDDASTLSSKTNTFNQGEATRLLEAAMPGFSGLQKQLMAKIGQDLNSEASLPSDVKDQIAQFAAERGVARGTSGNFNGFSLVKDFGFNLIDWKNAQRARALNTLSTVFNMAPRVNPMSPMAMMVDPGTAIHAAGQNNSMQYNIDQAGLNAQTAASNHNRSLVAGIVQNAFSAAAGAAGGSAGVQSKALAAPTTKTAAPGFGLQSQVTGRDSAGVTHMSPYVVRG